jgi:WhiB family redox-sensing transcriptional regulator
MVQAAPVARPRPPLPKNQTWREEAACKGIDANVFFPAGETGEALGQAAAAKVLCEGCPVRMACLDFALVTKQEYGIWGGRTEGERRSLRSGTGRAGAGREPALV